jgi:hypothetical protein
MFFSSIKHHRRIKVKEVVFNVLNCKLKYFNAKNVLFTYHYHKLKKKNMKNGFQLILEK